MASAILLYVYHVSDVIKCAVSKVCMCVGTDLSLSCITLITVQVVVHAYGMDCSQAHSPYLRHALQLVGGCAPKPPHHICVKTFLCKDFLCKDLLYHDLLLNSYFSYLVPT
jgi:hypothetical protein